jgi:hypothetical protein
MTDEPNRLPASRRSSERDFEVWGDRLLRTVALPDGRRYTHSCAREVLRAVAYELEQRADDGTTVRAIAQALDVPSTQAYVARAFLLERGLIACEHRRCFPASPVLVEDAMCEFHALAENRKGVQPTA